MHKIHSVQAAALLISANSGSRTPSRRLPAKALGVAADDLPMATADVAVELSVASSKSTSSVLLRRVSFRVRPPPWIRSEKVQRGRGCVTYKLLSARKCML
jgi:hypothetical protein